MNTEIERRRHPRVPLSLPVVLMTPQGAIKGKTVDISVGGLAVMLFLYKPEIGDEFEVTLKTPEGHEMSVTCKKVWWGKYIFGEILYNGIGVRFSKISPSDLDIIKSMVGEYYGF